MGTEIYSVKGFRQNQTGKDKKEMDIKAYKWGNPAALLPYTTRAGEHTQIPEYAFRLLTAFEKLTDEQKEAITLCAVGMAERNTNADMSD